LFYKLFGKRGLFVWIFKRNDGEYQVWYSFFNHWHSKAGYGEKETENAVFAALISLSVIVQDVLFFNPKIVLIPRIALGNNYFYSIALLDVYPFSAWVQFFITTY
jgi:hypothetical protein